MLDEIAEMIQDAIDTLPDDSEAAHDIIEEIHDAIDKAEPELGFSLNEILLHIKSAENVYNDDPMTVEDREYITLCLEDAKVETLKSKEFVEVAR